MPKKYEARADKAHDVKQVANPRGERSQRYIADNDETKDRDRQQRGSHGAVSPNTGACATRGNFIVTHTPFCPSPPKGGNFKRPRPAHPLGGWVSAMCPGTHVFAAQRSIRWCLRRHFSATHDRRFEMANVADRIVETLEAANVRRIYGLVGDSLNGITESLRVRGKIDWIPVRHEEVAAFAAGAQAQLTGEVAVYAGSCGPGKLHLTNGLFACHRSRVPVVAIAAHIPSTEIGSSYFQETHPQSLFKECSHYVELISDPLQVPRIVETAIREAVAKQGVAVIVISGDVALKEAGPRAPPPHAGSRLPRVCAAEAGIGGVGRFPGMGGHTTPPWRA